MVVFIDLAKAFDTVDHNILLNKLKNYGGRGIYLKLLKSYLEGRQQYGPLLFLVYIDDMKYCSNILHLVLFADDTNFFLMSNNLNFLITTVNMELDKLLNWFKANKLSLNREKTNFILFKSARHRLQATMEVKIDGVAIKRVKNCKFLEIIIDENLT